MEHYIQESQLMFDVPADQLLKAFAQQMVIDFDHWVAQTKDLDKLDKADMGDVLGEWYRQARVVLHVLDKRQEDDDE